MQVKNFEAESFTAAMDLVRGYFGDDAIILDSYEDKERGVSVVRVARDNHTEPDFIPQNAENLDAIDYLTIILEKHDVLPELMDDMLDIALGDTTTDDPVKMLTKILEQRFVFRPLHGENQEVRPFLMVGPPGSGKTIASVKMAGRALLQGKQTCIIGADNMKVGGLDPLIRYCDRLGVDLLEARNQRELSDALSTCMRDEIVLVDTPGVNPYQPTELAHLVELCDIPDLEVVLVIDGGRSSLETLELVDAFRHILPTRLLATKIDVARRVGALLHAADKGKLAISEVSLNPQIADGLYPLTASSLARLMVSNVSLHQGLRGIPSSKNQDSDLMISSLATG